MVNTEKRFYYITPEDTVTAESNGINYANLYQRVHGYGWDVDRAITQPVRKEDPFHSNWIDTAKKNGVKLSIFRARVRKYGWSEEVAATTPIISAVERGKRAGGARSRFTQEQIKAMESLGLARSTVLQRINSYGWSMEEALTTPTLTLAERSKRVRAATANYKKRLAK